ncbi:unnamed protein product [Paramecium sonneborni]|uniref:Uncharacterized protein n=1 Tax=Paramecium sonneborni TaxID=65129 RepID=A0A8S1Q0B5_9CILI|nr:unnamed protein product [Paramecium sonneborni]
MGCSQVKTKQPISLNLIQSKSYEAMTQSNFQQDNHKFNIMKNPIIKRRTEKRNKMSQTTACTPTLISS